MWVSASSSSARSRESYKGVLQHPVGEYGNVTDKIVRGHMKSILDPSLRYTASFNTDLHKTFARIRRDRRQEADRAAQASPDGLAKVSSIVRKKATGRA